MSWLLVHPNVLPFLGIDGETFNSVPCIVTPWQNNGNILDCLKRFTSSGLPILIDEWVSARLTQKCTIC